MKNITDSCELISSRVDFKPTVGVILGSGLGELIGMTVLLTIQLNMSVGSGVWVVGLIVLIMALIVVSMIREPKLKNHN